jgi:hypothetical protein
VIGTLVNVGETKDYITVWDVKDGEELTIKDEGELRTFRQRDGTERKRIVIGVKEYAKKLVLNETSKNELASKWGGDTAKWIGKKIRVTLSTVVVQGRTTKAIFVSPA